MVERRNIDRIQRPTGSQPSFHDSPTVDALTAMVVALLGEVMVLRDRLDANERLSAHGPEAVDRFQPDTEAAKIRMGYRNATYDRVLGAARDRLIPEALRQEQSAYDLIMDDVAGH